ncbi:nucleoside hydrolase-like [Mytilus galloprovincialis]|uniref:nucleoside hydrolase-like n=1 Tax=Mytilus galloprovincialis TaxID=29158 RepID=UPI003F7B8572
MATMKMIIDVDTGVDDASAIMLALSRPEVEVVAITCVNGNVAIDDVCRNTLRVLKVCNRLDIPVYKGAEKSILGEGERASHYHGNDGLGDAQNHEPVDITMIKTEHAVNALLQLVNENPGEITLVALAPLTNIALALRLDPDFGSKLKEVFIMGGNIEGKGGDRLGAEFNFFADPEAAYVTLQELHCQTTIVSWELCKSVGAGVSWDWYNQWVEVDTNKARFFKNICRMTAERNRNIIKTEDFSLCDLLAMALAIDNNIITEYLHVWSTVELGGVHTRGQLISDWRNKTKNPPNVRIVKKFSIEKAKEYYMSMVL